MSTVVAIIKARAVNLANARERLKTVTANEWKEDYKTWQHGEVAKALTLILSSSHILDGRQSETILFGDNRLGFYKEVPNLLKEYASDNGLYVIQASCFVEYEHGFVFGLKEHSPAVIINESSSSGCTIL